MALRTFAILTNRHMIKHFALRRYNAYNPSPVILLSQRILHAAASDKPDDKFIRREKSNFRKHFENEKDFIPASIQNDPDTFGPRISEEPEGKEDPGDLQEEEYIQNPRPRQLREYEYIKMIKKHLGCNELDEAIDVVFVRMKKDRVQPKKYFFNLLISGCAKVGQAKKAFKIYNKMKQYGVSVSPNTYTSLFNACANDSFLQNGINRANRLREIMIETGYEPNEKNYNAMIKAYGRCGDIKTAFQIADEMLEKQFPIKTDTFNFLLQACISERDLGFRYALLIWHKMRKMGLKPDLYSFNLMLRCVRYCSIGDIKLLEDVITKILTDIPIKKNEREVHHKSNEKEVLQITSNEKENEENTSINLQEHSLTTNNTSLNRKTSSLELTDKYRDSSSELVLDATPNLLSNNPHLGSLVSISEIRNPEDRLILLGGLSGFLEEMKTEGITPGIETFTVLLEVMPSTRSAEKRLIAMIRKIGLKADIDFFNVLMKKRSMRFDYEGAKEVLSMMKTAKLQADIVTYGVMALSCQTQEEARELMQTMHQKGIKMNIQIAGAMLKQGCSHMNFPYIHEVLKITLEERIQPNEKFLQHLDEFGTKCTKLLETKHPSTRKKYFKEDYDNFKNRLNLWYREHKIEGLKLEDAIKKIKETSHDKQNGGEMQNEKLLKKRKIRKYINRIKMKDLKDDEGNENTTTLKQVIDTTINSNANEKPKINT